MKGNPEERAVLLGEYICSICTSTDRESTCPATMV